MALRHVTTAAIAAGLTVGALLATPDVHGHAADGAALVNASAATLGWPTASAPKTLAAGPSTAAVPEPPTAEPAPTPPPATAAAAAPILPAAPQPVGDVSALTGSGIPETALD